MRYLFLIFFYFVTVANAQDLAPGTLFAAKVIDLDSDEVVFEKQSDMLLMPASSQKLLTLYSAMKLLDLNDTFRTSVYTDGKIRNGVLEGNLYIKFTGDPELTAENVEQLIESVKRHKIKEISKNIVIDDSEFDDEYVGPGWPADQTKFCYSAPISSIMIDRNCYTYNRSNSTKGVRYLPEKFPTFAHVLDKSKESELDNLCEFELRAFGDNSYILDGCYQKKDLPESLSIAVQDPRKNAIELIGYIFNAKKINFKDIKMGTTPEKAKEIAYLNSRPIKHMLPGMVKDSDNIVSEIIFKRISAKNTEYQGSSKNSSKLISDLLAKDVKLPRSKFSVRDGSGVSRKDLISPSAFVDILKTVYKDEKMRDEFISKLPVAGIDGTLKKRFKETHLESIVKAKTGSIDHVSTLTGYAFMPSGKKYAFCIMANSSFAQEDNLKKNEEDLLVSLLTN